MINSVNNCQWVKTKALLDNKQQNQTSSATLTATEAASDVVEIGKNTQTSLVYSRADAQKSDAVDIKALQEQVEKATENLRNLVQKLLVEQGKKSTKATSLYANAVNQANRAISEDGDFGVEAVSDRIVDFAIVIAGNDKSKLEELKAAIDRGFKEAGKSFGKGLPDICNKTYDAIMEKLDRWSQEG